MIPVASYCRVSTDQEDQANSFENQQRYFQEYISRQPDWELYMVYADRGITGTSTKRRTAFNQMIQDARQGKFRLILTKEVSRFSRNILDTIAYTRELRKLGIGVLFMNDGINTLDPDAELRLSIMGSIAQEESRRTSSRVKWGQLRQMEKGVVFGKSLLGYDVKDGSLTVNPEGAEVVRLIFQKYAAEKKGTTLIARELREAGYRTSTGSRKWSNSHIIKILKSEKYVGDLVQKKTITPDYLTHAKKYNHGEEPLVILRNHHEPLISRELWDAAQAELQKRSRKGKPGHSTRYLFSGKIKCGECGASFVARKRIRRDGTDYRRWSCYTSAAGKRCGIGRTLRDELALGILKQTLLAVRIDRGRLIEQTAELAAEALLEGRDDAERLEREIGQLTRKKADVLDAFFSERITEEDMNLINRRYDKDLEALRKRRDAARREDTICQEDIQEQITAIVNGGADSEAFYRNILDHMAVCQGSRVEVYLNSLPQKWSYLLERGSF